MTEQEKEELVRAEYAAEREAAFAESEADSNEKVNVSVRLPSTLVTRLRYESETQQISLSELVRRKLDDRASVVLTPAQEERIKQLINEVTSIAA